MNIDWKDALGALKSSGAIPEDNSPEPTDESSQKDEGSTKGSVQKSPLYVITDRKGRKGKTATIIEGFSLPDQEVEDIARTLRQRLATGGSARGGEILLQGDRRKEAADLLRGMGHKATVR